MIYLEGIGAVVCFVIALWLMIQPTDAETWREGWRKRNWRK